LQRHLKSARGHVRHSQNPKRRGGGPGSLGAGNRVQKCSHSSLILHGRRAAPEHEPLATATLVTQRIEDCSRKRITCTVGDAQARFIRMKSRSRKRRYLSQREIARLMDCARNVRLPPGRLRLATSPTVTGSTDTLKTIGIAAISSRCALSIQVC